MPHDPEEVTFKVSQPDPSVRAGLAFFARDDHVESFS
jgi:hypothetical protein